MQLLEAGAAGINEFHTGTAGGALSTLAEQALVNCGYKQIRYPPLPGLAASVLALDETIHHPGALRLICVLDPLASESLTVAQL